MTVPRIMIIALALSSLAGCGDERYGRFAERASDRQAEQNREVAKQSQTVAETTRQFVEAEARRREEFAQREQQLAAERQAIQVQRDALEAERRTISAQRHWDSQIASILAEGLTVLACLLPLGLAAYVVFAVHRVSPEEALAELLVYDLTSDAPVLLPQPRSPLALQASQGDPPSGEAPKPPALPNPASPDASLPAATTSVRRRRAARGA